MRCTGGVLGVTVAGGDGRTGGLAPFAGSAGGGGWKSGEVRLRRRRKRWLAREAECFAVCAACCAVAAILGAVCFTHAVAFAAECFAVDAAFASFGAECFAAFVALANVVNVVNVVKPQRLAGLWTMGERDGSLIGVAFRACRLPLYKGGEEYQEERDEQNRQGILSARMVRAGVGTTDKTIDMPGAACYALGIFCFPVEEDMQKPAREAAAAAVVSGELAAEAGCTQFSFGDARERFAELLDKTQENPVAIAKQGESVAVVLSMEEYKRLRRIEYEHLQRLDDAYWAGRADATLSDDNWLGTEKSAAFMKELLNAED